jgi:hypothetical protein
MSGAPISDDPFVDLADMLDERIGKHQRAAMLGTGLWLGTITSSYGLLLDGMTEAIPDYLISHHLALAEPDMTQTEMDGTGQTDMQLLEEHPHSHDRLAHVHQVINPPPLHHLHPGDRVVAAALNGGADWLVLARVIHISQMPR